MVDDVTFFNITGLLIHVLIMIIKTQMVILYNIQQYKKMTNNTHMHVSSVFSLDQIPNGLQLQERSYLS
jgi:radical SAM superfamily enzyme